MLGVELIEPGKNEPATQFAITLVKRALRAGIILLADSPTANVLSFTPPFSISDEEIAFAAAWLERALAQGA